MRVTRAKSALVYSKTPLLFPQTPRFSEEDKRFHNEAPETRDYALAFFWDSPTEREGRHLTAKHKGQSDKNLNLFRTKGESIFSSANSLHTHEKKRSRSRFHVLRSINPIYFAIFAR